MVGVKVFMAQRHRLIKTYSFSAVSVLSFGINFLQNFIFAALLERESFGKIFLLSSLFSLFSYLFVFGLDTALFKFYYDLDFADKKQLMVSVFSTWLILSLGLFILILILGYVIIEKFGYNLINFDLSFVLLVASGMMFSFFLICQQYFVASKQFWLYAMVSLGIRTIILIFNLVTIFLTGADLNYFVYSYFGSICLVFLILLFNLGLFKWLKFEREPIRDILTFSYPLAINSILGISFTNGYRVLISSILSFNGMALFGMISQISSAYYIGLSSLLLPHNPKAYRYLQETNKFRTIVPDYKEKCLQLGVSGFIGVLGLSFILLKYFKNGEYFDGFFMLPILLLAQFFFLLYSHEYIILSYYKLTSRITFATSTGIALMLIVFYFLTSLLGVWGACIVTLIGYLGQYFSAVTFRRSIEIKK